MTNFGRYEILKKLGEGASAVVMRASDTQFKREVALKILKPGMAVDSASFARFAQEAQTASKLFHPHIATVLDMGEVQGRYYIAMRYIPGASLDKILQQHHALPWEVTQRLAQQIGEALDYAHGQGFLHRDVKPANIMCARDGSFVLTDFGLTRAMMSSGVASVSGSVVGTPYYIAPEIWKGETASPASDQYSFACVLYETLTGKVLFPGETPAAVMTRHVLNPPEFTVQWPSNVPGGVREVLDRALEKIPAKRYLNLGELSTALSQAVNIAPIATNAPMPAHTAQPQRIAPRPQTETVLPPASVLPAPQPAALNTAAPKAQYKPNNAPRRHPQPAPNPPRKSPMGWVLAGSLGLITILCLALFIFVIPQITHFLDNKSDSTVQSGSNQQPMLLATSVPTVLTQSTQASEAPQPQDLLILEQPTQAPIALPTEAPPPTLVPTNPPDPNPALSLPFSDDFSQGLAAPWRVVSGKPVVQNSFLLAANDELTIEIGNTELQKYTLEMEVRNTNGNCLSNPAGQMILRVSPTLQLVMKNYSSVWETYDNKKWEDLISEPYGFCGFSRLVVNGTSYKLYTLYKDDQEPHELVYESAQGPLLLMLTNSVRIGNLTIK